MWERIERTRLTGTSPRVIDPHSPGMHFGVRGFITSTEIKPHLARDGERDEVNGGKPRLLPHPGWGGL